MATQKHLPPAAKITAIENVTLRPIHLLYAAHAVVYSIFYEAVSGVLSRFVPGKQLKQMYTAYIQEGMARQKHLPSAAQITAIENVTSRPLLYQGKKQNRYLQYTKTRGDT